MPALASRPSAAALATSLFDSGLTKPSAAAIASFTDQRRAMTTLLMTPEFQRR